MNGTAIEIKKYEYLSDWPFRNVLKKSYQHMFRNTSEERKY